MLLLLNEKPETFSPILTLIFLYSTCSSPTSFILQLFLTKYCALNKIANRKKSEAEYMWREYEVVEGLISFKDSYLY